MAELITLKGLIAALQAAVDGGISENSVVQRFAGSSKIGAIIVKPNHDGTVILFGVPSVEIEAQVRRIEAFRKAHPKAQLVKPHV
jgi:hypothetical protein